MQRLLGLFLALAMLIAPLAATTQAGEAHAHPVAATAAMNTEAGAVETCCEAAGHHAGTSCPMLVFLLPGAPVVPGADPEVSRLPRPGNVSFRAVVPAGLFDPPRAT
ncbi:hypothetical protein [Roseovarius salinarum]|uniref:hypothetical protein n=1 Tax=Roseovarius salinarum TaxID=1981892 RepID=UPI0013000EDE|nr:hypothetical protein [Roseovarius salinarum]